MRRLRHVVMRLHNLSLDRETHMMARLHDLLARQGIARAERDVIERERCVTVLSGL